MARLTCGKPQHKSIRDWNLDQHKPQRILEVVTTGVALLHETSSKGLETFIQRDVDDYEYHLPSLATWGIIDVVGERDMGIITLSNGRKIHSYVKVYAFTLDCALEMERLKNFATRTMERRMRRTRNDIEDCLRKEIKYAERRKKLLAKMDEMQEAANKLVAKLEALN